MKKYLLILVACFGFSSVSQAVVVLDFDSLATGSDITNNPLVTADGTITSSATSGNLYITSGAGGGMTGNALRFDETVDGGYAQLAFNYDVGSISFLYAGFLSGYFNAQILDSSFNVIDSFFDGNTNDDLPGGPVVLSGSNIRYFRFFDGPGGASFAGVDDLVITAAGVPEPTTLALLGLGLFGVAFSRKKKA
ncbi:MAG: PEP-CTERM sorting domain-containing protein [Gammaproteobacteria bacterium]|nr:PEP-CTERM sorting domain-containing protein [Gammaproteobacteria bacterium]MDH5650736.1 PEP-CTERM sorting domain-containing protein [Gammaproteobacteria bacterium]